MTQEIWGGITGLASSIVIGVLAITGLNKKIDKKVDISECSQCRQNSNLHFEYIKESLKDIKKTLDKHIVTSDNR